MKSIFATLALAASLSATAFAGPVSQDQVYAYKTAIQMALSAKDYDCKNLNGDTVDTKSVKQYVAEFSDIYVNENTTAPALLLSRKSTQVEELIKLNTSADYKTILSIDYAGYQEETVNTGTLTKPNLQKRMALRTAVKCAIK